MRGLQWPAPHVQENFGHCGREGQKKKKGEKPGHSASRRRVMKKIFPNAQSLEPFSDSFPVLATFPTQQPKHLWWGTQSVLEYK